MSTPRPQPQLQFEIVTPPQVNFHTADGKLIMLAVCGGGPGMNAGYLRPLVESYPSVLIGWARRDSEGRPLRGKEALGLEAQQDYIEAVRQQVASELSYENLCLIPVAHSAAGPRCVSWAAHHPEHVAGLVLLDAVVGRPRLPYSPLKLFSSLLVYRLLHHVGWEEAFRARFMQHAGRYYFRHPTPELEAEFIAAWESPFWDLLLKSGFEQSDVRELLKTLRVPILFLYGDLDQMVSPEEARQQQQAQQALEQSATLHLVPGVGHLSILERPLACAAALQEFLQSLVSLPVAEAGPDR